MYPREFEYIVPASLDEALAALAENEGAKVLAGGMSLINLMKLRLFSPPALIDIGRIPGLDAIEDRGDHLAIGALVRHGQTAADPLINQHAKALAQAVPGLIGGGADLTGNTGTDLGDTAASPQNPGGRQIYFGVREHAMGAAMVGMALHGGTIPFGGTFLVFSDYMRPAIRLAALSGAKAIFVFSHDSVGVGEDGPTHQPVEQIEALRLIPGLRVLRPADANETVQSWQVAISGEGPVALILSRQNLETLAGTATPGSVASGGYVLVSGGASPEVTLIGTGSEVAVCRDAAELLAASGTPTRVVSMPDTDAFAARDAADQASVLGGCPVVAVEAGVTNGWYRFADDAVGIDRFGASAPGDTVMAELGITAAHVAERAKALLGR